MTLTAEAIRRAEAAQARALVVVDHDSTPVAIVNETAVMATPEQRRPWIEVGTLARAIDQGLVLPADLSGMALLDAVRQYPASSKVSFENFARVQIHRTLYSEINRTKQWFDASPAHLAPTQSFFA